MTFIKNQIEFSFIGIYHWLFNLTLNLTKKSYPVILHFLYNLAYELKVIISLLLMTINKARKLLGKDAELYSDEQITAIMEKARNLSLACVRKIDTNMAEFGMSFFNEKKYLKENQLCQEQ